MAINHWGLKNQCHRPKLKVFGKDDNAVTLTLIEGSFSSKIK